MQTTRPQERGEEGFLLIAMIVAIFLILLALSVAAPRIAMQLKRERELETAHRANQYVRGIRMYYKKLGSYPPSMEALKKSNNIRFLRQEYVDPLTGEKDWKLIRVGQNKTKVKGFFGEDLPGLAGGLGSAAGLISGGSTGSALGSTLGSASSLGSPSSSPTSATSGTPTNSSPGATAGTSDSTGSSFGSTAGSGFGSGAGAGSGFGSESTLAGTGGPFMGVAVPKSGEAIVVVNEQTNYQDWEFLYDPRIEQMYAKANLLGGGVSSGSATGLGSAGSLGSGFGGNPSTNAPGSPGSPINSPSSTTPSPSPTTPPQ